LDPVARGIDSAADSLHANADRLPGGERVADAAHSAADGMERAADYLRDQDLRGMLSDVRESVARHPGAALLAAAALGFVIARSLSRD
jgi:hypothetical protein